MLNEIEDLYGHLDGAELLEPLIRRDYPGKIALVSSFGAESAVLLHLVATIDKNVPVIFIDTGKLFWETKSYRSRMIDRLGFTDVRSFSPDEADLAQRDPDGLLHKLNADLCCHIRKTKPLENALAPFEAWISGRKRFHGGGREKIPLVSYADGRVKVEPLARWTASDLQTYMLINELPAHPLVAEGYRSIGCVPCTTKAGTADDPRAGRWEGTAKTECGIHWTANGQPIRMA